MEKALANEPRLHVPYITQEMKFFEKRHTLPDAAEGVKVEFRGLAHAAIVAVTRGSSVPLHDVDDWMDRLMRYDYSWGTMEELVSSSQAHLVDLNHHELAVGSLEQAARLDVLANKFGELLTRLSKAAGFAPVPASPVPPDGKSSLAACLKEAQDITDLGLRKKYEAVIRYNWYLRELRALRVASKRYQTPDLLKKQFPEFEVWSALDTDDERDVAAGNFDPGRFSWALIQRLNNQRGRDDRTLQNYRKALRAAGISI